MHASCDTTPSRCRTQEQRRQEEEAAAAANAAAASYHSVHMASLQLDALHPSKLPRSFVRPVMWQNPTAEDRQGLRAALLELVAEQNAHTRAVHSGVHSAAAPTSAGAGSRGRAPLSCSSAAGGLGSRGHRYSMQLASQASCASKGSVGKAAAVPVPEIRVEGSHYTIDSLGS